MNNRSKEYINTPFECDVWFVDFRKSGQKRLVRYFRRNGLNKRKAKQMAHTVYIESNRDHFLQGYTYSNLFNVHFVYCW